MPCPEIEFADCRLTDRSQCDVTIADFAPDVAHRLMLMQLETNAAGPGTARERELRRDYVRARDAALNELRACARATNTDHKSPAGVTMDPDLEAALKLVNVRTDGLSQRDIALSILRAVGTDPNSATSNGQPITAREDAYLAARAFYAAQGYQRSRTDAAIAQSFATVKPTPAPVVHADCGCGGKPHADHVDDEEQARIDMHRESRAAFTQGNEARASELAAKERRRDRDGTVVTPLSDTTMQQLDAAQQVAEYDARVVQFSPEAIKRERAAKIIFAEDSRTAYREKTDRKSEVARMIAGLTRDVKESE